MFPPSKKERGGGGNNFSMRSKQIKHSNDHIKGNQVRKGGGAPLGETLGPGTYRPSLHVHVCMYVCMYVCTYMQSFIAGFQLGWEGVQYATMWRATPPRLPGTVFPPPPPPPPPNFVIRSCWWCPKGYY